MMKAEKLKGVLEPSWEEVLANEMHSDYFLQLAEIVAKERKSGVPIYPPREEVFRAFWETPYDKVKVVILGQDPYHGESQANGLCFSVHPGIDFPPSLHNIFLELKNDLGIPIPKDGDLSGWAKQGVLLLNATLTVRHKQPLSHAGLGWERFTDAVIISLAKRSKPVIFLLWGKYARDKWQKVRALGLEGRHAVIESAHPSPLSAHRGFLGSRPFSRINQQLIAWGVTPIDWAYFHE